MNRRPLATQRPASAIHPVETSVPGPSTGDAAEKKWQVDDASGVPAPIIRANMISFRRSFQGQVKVTFFEQD